MLASISSASVLGATGRPVTVEVHVGTGLPSYQIIGLPDEACRESRDRVRAAVLSSGLAWPTDKRVTVNLAPSGERKTGAGLDVAIAVGVLAAFEQLPSDAAQRYGYVGELGLDGSLRPVPGVAPMVGVLCGREVVVPVASQVEARVVATAAVHPVSRLREIADVLIEGAPWPESALPELAYTEQSSADLADVHGQPIARLALEVAAAGGHHLLFVGPPGAGKTMLASRLVGILPNLERQQALEVTMIHSAAGLTLPPGGLGGGAGKRTAPPRTPPPPHAPPPLRPPPPPPHH
ncbi:MAG: magnesium chelatase domain-containing protein, partial [Ilumatobacteraceae bacterium]